MARSRLDARGWFALVVLAGAASQLPPVQAALASADDRPRRPPAVAAPIAGDCPRLSDRELAGVVRRHWPAGEQVRAFAVALGESSGKPCAVGDVHLQRGDWGPSVCLWQMRSLHSQRGTGGLRDEVANLRSVETCARHARQLQVAGGWRHWSAYTNGTYRQYLGRARTALR